MEIQILFVMIGFSIKNIIQTSAKKHKFSLVLLKTNRGFRERRINF